MRRYPPSTTYRCVDLPSTQIIQTHNPHRHNTDIPFQTLPQAPLPTYTTATQTQTHIYTGDLPPPRSPFQIMSYTDDITITPTHTSTSAAKIYIQPYLHIFARTKHSNLTLNPDKTTCTLFTPDPAEYKNNLDLKINHTLLSMAVHPKVLRLTLDPKLTYSTHIHNISVHAHKPLQIIKSLTATAWGKL